MKPLLAHIYEPHRVTFPCYVQPKLNGIRALYQNGRFQSRDEIPFPPGLLDHLAKPLLDLFPPEVILDGELYKHGWPLGRINGAVTPVRQQPTEDTREVEFHVFDVVDFTKTFEQRFFNNDWLNQLKIGGRNREGGPCFRVATTQTETNTADFFYSTFVDCGYEGMMYRLGDCPYTVPKQELKVGDLANPIKSRTRWASDKDNRVWHMLKRKDWQDDEFPFISLNETQGEKGERGFQMWCRAHNGKPFKVSSGLSHGELDHYLSNPPEQKKIKVKYLVLSEDGIPLNATILAIL